MSRQPLTSDDDGQLALPLFLKKHPELTIKPVSVENLGNNTIAYQYSHIDGLWLLYK
jgi:hypothetical protein